MINRGIHVAAIVMDVGYNNACSSIKLYTSIQGSTEHEYAGQFGTIHAVSEFFSQATHQGISHIPCPIFPKSFFVFFSVL